MDKLESELRVFRPTKRQGHIFTASENANYFDCALKLFICDKILEELKRSSPSLRSNLLVNRRITAVKRLFKRRLMKYKPQRQSTITKT